MSFYKLIMNKQFISILKHIKHKGRCAICGETADCCLEFHHIQPSEKHFSLRSVSEKHYTKEQLVEELNKTCLLCKCCHTKLHNGLLPQITEEYLNKYRIHYGNTHKPKE